MCAEPAIGPVQDPLLSPLLGGGAGFPQGHLEPSGHAAWLLSASQGSSPGNSSSPCASVSPRLPWRQQFQQGGCSGVPAIAVCQALCYATLTS